MSKILKATDFTSDFEARYKQSGTVDLQAGTDPSFGGEKIETIEAAGGVLSFNSAGKMVTAKALSHFGVLGTTVTEGSVVELPEADFNSMKARGQVVEATDEDIAAAQKASKGK